VTALAAALTSGLTLLNNVVMDRSFLLALGDGFITCLRHCWRSPAAIERQSAATYFNRFMKFFLSLRRPIINRGFVEIFV
jgi:hypothetical protein